MRKKKEDAQLTKELLLQTSFQLFYENGFDRTSLEEICRAAKVTRGAAYWHFENKQAIFQQTVRAVLDKIHTVFQEQIQKNGSFTPRQALVEMLWLPHAIPTNFDFIRKTMVHISSDPTFAPLCEEVHQAKMRQYDYFLQTIQRLRPTNPRLNALPAQETALLLFSLFDGIYNGDIPSTIPVKIDKNILKHFVDFMLDN